MRCSIASKKLMVGENKVDHLNLLLVTSQICCIIVAPIWFYREGYGLIFGEGLARFGLSAAQERTVLLELLGGSLANCVQTLVAFSFLSLFEPVSYSVANLMKRIVIIGASLVWFQRSPSPLNFVGMSFALGGVFVYNQVKIWDARAAAHSSTLPVTVVDTKRSQH